ncbi:ABC transporter ATP-binding protein [Leptospira sp. GIMC2001]|uniref:ABC transporter ATP-binding protein n=1 Tax=Leptospira sp. GIMC2001 TaxID=1513297 RepID=UPI00234A8238|nr:ABC transporter ATP-binding protein [Leptospira sp. GIMC2001]WCL49707.1 ABC transporter ATP-binding protein [Leptospira sp. GIMC2001]
MKLKKEIIFCTSDLEKVYQMGEVQVRALNSINLEIHKSEFVVLLGPSGSGKSTLLNILGGLDTPSSGDVVFNNQKLSKASEEELTAFRRLNVGFVFQFYNLIPSLTSRENILLVTELTSKSMNPDDALSMVGLYERREHFPSQLSGGEQQRVAIARAIAKKPEILLCDEPTGALDIKTGRIVLEAIAKVNKELGTTTIIITHNESIAQIADRVITMRDGEITSDTINKAKKSTAEISW